MEVSWLPEYARLCCRCLRKRMFDQRSQLYHLGFQVMQLFLKQCLVHKLCSFIPLLVFLPAYPENKPPRSQTHHERCLQYQESITQAVCFGEVPHLAPLLYHHEVLCPSTVPKMNLEHVFYIRAKKLLPSDNLCDTIENAHRL